MRQTIKPSHQDMATELAKIMEKLCPEQAISSTELAKLPADKLMKLTASYTEKLNRHEAKKTRVTYTPRRRLG